MVNFFIGFDFYLSIINPIIHSELKLFNFKKIINLHGFDFCLSIINSVIHSELKQCFVFFAGA